MKKLFVSYSREDAPVVGELVQHLADFDFQVWHDQKLSGGQKWWEDILSQIRSCDVFIVAVSPHAIDSEACRSELRYALELGREILPVQISPAVNLSLLPHPLDTIQSTDYTARDMGAVKALVRAVNKTSSSRPLPDPLPNPPSVPVSYLGSLKDRIDQADELSRSDQLALVGDLADAPRMGHSISELRDLLVRMSRRTDLLAVTLERIKAIEASLGLIVPSSSQRATADLPVDSRDVRQSSPACPRCGIPASAGAFCASCGAALGTGAVPPALPARREGATRTYSCRPDDLRPLVRDVDAWLESLNFESQEMTTEDKGTLLQVRKKGTWRNFVGMATALNILFRQHGDVVEVEVGSGQWLDKAAVGAVSIFVLWPLAVTAGIGAWEQMKMPQKVFTYIGTKARQLPG